MISMKLHRRAHFSLAPRSSSSRVVVYASCFANESSNRPSPSQIIYNILTCKEEIP